MQVSNSQWLSDTLQRYRKQQVKYEALQIRFAEAVRWGQERAARDGSLASVNAQVQELALYTQQQCEKLISDLVTRCLQAIFPENKYTFALIFEQKREQTECRCILRDAEGNEYDPIAACGGGVVDVICFALRLATLILRVPQSSKILILDEPFRFVSKEHRSRLVDLLVSLCTETGFQIIMVTHLPELATRGNVIEL